MILQHSERTFSRIGTELELVRRWFSDKSTIGVLNFDGEFQCFTLEDVVRAVKVPKETAIPVGRYEVRLTHSNRFGRTMPILCDVPNYVGVRIHAGNVAADTEGCLLVGEEALLKENKILHSREAFEKLFAKLEKSPGPRFITIREERNV